MLSQLRPAVIVLGFFTLLTGLAYPLAMTGLGHLIAPVASQGSMVTMNGKAVGSALIGQAWTSDKYFHGRPSAAGEGYDASASSGSNLGPTSAKLKDRVAEDIATLRTIDPSSPLPADAVTASGSGLDPEISPEFARMQVARVARARGLGEDQVRAVVETQVTAPLAGLFGEPRVNVLLLNLALDQLNSPTNG